MGNYLDVNYFRDEYSPKMYPQLLCNHLVNEYYLKNFNGNVNGKKLLDIGSGKGNHIVGFSRNGIECYGIDKRDECVEILKDYEIRYCDIENESFPYDNDYFDMIFSKSVLEHVYNGDNFLSETYRVLKPNGIALLMCPDWGSHYKVFWDDHTHVNAWTRKGLQDAMEIHNFLNVNVSYFRQLPILWKYPMLNILSDITSLLPESFKWKDEKERDFRTWIRFSKEKMLLGLGSKIV